MGNIFGIIDIHDVDVYDHHSNVEHVHHTAKDMMFPRVFVPLELDELLDGFGVEDFKLFCFVNEPH